LPNQQSDRSDRHSTHGDLTGVALAIQEKLTKAQNRAADVFASLYLPQLPTRQEIVRRALAMFADTPSIDVIYQAAEWLTLAGIHKSLAK
jgi:hypothetical protein